ncbi:MAG: Fumarate reductase iron-sulfur subunit [Chlamydiia bacterium]|nr:Fumarate reductase iron-sulfur subunit [Chlamydiia bacterium]
MSSTQTKTFTLKVYRGDQNSQYFVEFELDRREGLNVISALMEIQRNPITKTGERVTPIVWEQACLEEVCGSCSMLINGRPRQACTALIEEILKADKTNTIILAPFTKFPLIRDLVVDRSSMFESLKKIKGWIPVEGYHSEEFGPTISPKKQEAMYVESTCMTCGCCLEACPQFSDRSKFVGAAAINQVKYFNSNETGKALKDQRLTEMMKEGGVSDCGNAQNCVQVCPKKIPLTQSIASIGKDVVKSYFNRKFSLPEKSE